MPTKKVKPADYLFWAVKQQTGNPLRNLILIQLCNRAGKDGACWPSHETISKDCGCSERAVRDHLPVLEKLGLINLENRNKEGMKTSSKYTFPLATADRQEVPNVRQMVPNRSANGSKHDRQEMPIKHPISNTQQLNTHITPVVPFDSFYSAYPKKTKRAAALKAWNKLSPGQALINRIMQDIVNRVEQGAWCTGQGKQYIPDPSTYLNGNRWEDDIIPRPEFKPKTDYSAIAREFTEI